MIWGYVWRKWHRGANNNEARVEKCRHLACRHLSDGTFPTLFQPRGLPPLPSDNTFQHFPHWADRSGGPQPVVFWWESRPQKMSSSNLSQPESGRLRWCLTFPAFGSRGFLKGAFGVSMCLEEAPCEQGQRKFQGSAYQQPDLSDPAPLLGEWWGHGVGRGWAELSQTRTA